MRPHPRQGQHSQQRKSQLLADGRTSVGEGGAERLSPSKARSTNRVKP